MNDFFTMFQTAFNPAANVKASAASLQPRR